jgi:hypothetical protein
MEFLRRAVEPLFLYGAAGMGGWSLVWSLGDIYFNHGIFGDWYLLYNVIAPGLALATMGIAIREYSRGANDERTLCLMFLTLMGLLMSAKYINMSIIGVWQANALGFMIVLGWWARVYLQAARLVPAVQWGSYCLSWHGFSRGVVIAAIIALTLFSGDQRNVSSYGLQSWVHYASFPHLIDHIFRHRCHQLKCTKGHPSEKDIQLVAARGKPGEPVAIIDLYDWTYLIATKRPSMIPLLPSVDVFTEWQLDQSFKKLYTAEYIFLPKSFPEGDSKTLGIPSYNFAPALLPEIKAHFVRQAEGDRLVAWHRVSPHSFKDNQ